MEQMTKLSISDLSGVTRALQFIEVQLIELSKNCEKTWQNDQVSPEYFLELENKLEKILHETRAACRPPPVKPVKSDFDIIKQIGSGSFGTVDLVRQKETHQVFAMKKIKQQKGKKRDYVLLERDILTYLDHPLVVSMFCSFETKKHLYMVMEYVGGGDVDTLLFISYRFPVDKARFYIAEVILALEYIHSQGIIHRDLKPENLLLSTEGHIKLADFGLAKLGTVKTAACLTEEEIAREFTDTEMCGTAPFMPPEVILELGYGKPVDWWATGILLYNFLFGFTPFDCGLDDDSDDDSDDDDTDSDDHSFHCGYSDDDDEDADERKIFGRVICGDIPFLEAMPLPQDARSLIRLLLDKDCVKRLGTRGAYEVKGHPFFQDVDWSNLINESAPHVPELDNEEDIRCSRKSRSLLADESSDDDDDESSVKPTDFCYVAFRFKEVDGGPLPLSHSSEDGTELAVKEDSGADGTEPTVKEDSGADGTEPTFEEDSGADGTKPTVEEDSGADGTERTIEEDSGADGTEPTFEEDSGADGTKPTVEEDSGADSTKPTVEEDSGEDSTKPTVEEDSGEDNGDRSVDDKSTVSDHDATSNPNPVRTNFHRLLTLGLNIGVMMYTGDTRPLQQFVTSLL